jgi:hypothetical protein
MLYNAALFSPVRRFLLIHRQPTSAPILNHLVIEERPTSPQGRLVLRHICYQFHIDIQIHLRSKTKLTDTRCAFSPGVFCLLLFVVV